MKKAIIIVSSILVVAIAIMYMQFETRNQVLREFGIDNMTTLQMVEALEAKTISVDELNASISGTTLTLSRSGMMYKFAVPNNLFYLSIAPYINQTHPCGIHNLVTCRGELSNQTFDVTITSTTGEIIFSGQKTAQDNGFFGIWLPRGIDVDVTVRYGSLQSIARVSTNADSNTCLTTMQLQ